MNDKLRFLIGRLRERLWLRPLAMCVFSVTLAFAATLLDKPAWAAGFPDVSVETVEVLLNIIATSMLVIATFAVGSMVASYTSAGATATPRSFSLVVADDASQNALSSFIGAFIFSVVALVALKSGVYDIGGRFALLSLTLLVFAVVILTFLRWVDSIARLGRLGTTIEKVERAAATALGRRRLAPRLGGAPVGAVSQSGAPVHHPSVGYVQRIEVADLQACAERAGIRITVQALPGTFVTPGTPVAYAHGASGGDDAVDVSGIADAFLVGDERTFEEDPRFGLAVLSEIACRALSPAVNDPGTAVDIIGRFVRLFVDWTEPLEHGQQCATLFERVDIPELAADDMLDDAFLAIARDGAGAIEVAERLQAALATLAPRGGHAFREAALSQARMALARAESALSLAEDLQVVRDAAACVAAGGHAPSA